MDFIFDYLFPVLGKTILGLAVILCLVFIVVIIIILAQIKNYKEIKTNLAELKYDLKKHICGSFNKRKRIKILIAVLNFLLIVILISVFYIYSQQPQQLVITNPAEYTMLDTEIVTEIFWTPIPHTYEYHIFIHPATPGMYESTALYDFYVDGNSSSASLVLSEHICGVGKYEISVVSDANNTLPDSIIVYLNTSN